MKLYIILYFRNCKSLHCKYCNKCILRFDHHCKFVNNCIGVKNYKSVYEILIITNQLPHLD